MNVTIRMLVDTVPTTQMVFMRNLLGLGIIVLWVCLRREGTRILRTSKPKGHFWRAAIGFSAMELWFYSLSLMKLTLATALSFTTPIFATMFAVLILKEKAGWRRWSAVFAGFLGVLVMLRPGAGDVTLSAGVVLLSSALMALAGVAVKSLTRTEKPETIVLYMALYMTPLSLPLALPYWIPLDVHALALLLLIALLSTAAQLMMARAYRHADMVVVLPFDFTRLIFTAILAYVFFGETMDGPTIAGSAIIMASSLYIAHREAVRRRQG